MAAEHTCLITSDGSHDESHEADSEAQMGVAMALAHASRSGLLHAMLKDNSSKTARELAILSSASIQVTDDVILSLIQGNIVSKIGRSHGQEGEHRYHVPADRQHAVKEFGAIFEALLMRQYGNMDPEVTIRLVKFRCKKILAGRMSGLSAFGGKA